jgi:SH3-like domain-containing protein
MVALCLSSERRQRRQSDGRASLRTIRFLTPFLALAVSAAGLTGTAQASGEASAGKVTGLPIPRYVSLKTDRVNLREGPSKEHRTAWVFQRAGLPVEIVAEFETWRRIRDAEGTEGWVLHSLLSGRRTGLVTPVTKGDPQPVPLYERAADRTEIVARLQPGVIANVKQCGGLWCRIIVPQSGSGELDGYIHQDRLWGVYPGEKVE